MTSKLNDDDRLGQLLKQNRPIAKDATTDRAERIWRAILADAAKGRHVGARLRFAFVAAAAALALVISVIALQPNRNQTVVSSDETVDTAISSALTAVPIMPEDETVTELITLADAL